MVKNMKKKEYKQKHSTNKYEPKYEKAKFKVDDVDGGSIIINVSGWRMRVGVMNEDKNIGGMIGKVVEVEYVGDIENPTKNTPKFKPVKI